MGKSIHYGAPTGQQVRYVYLEPLVVAEYTNGCRGSDMILDPGPFLARLPSHRFHAPREGAVNSITLWERGCFAVVRPFRKHI